MACAWIEGVLAGRWGHDRRTLTDWERWGGGYSYDIATGIGTGIARLVITGNPGPPPAPPATAPPAARDPDDLA